MQSSVLTHKIVRMFVYVCLKKRIDTGDKDKIFDVLADIIAALYIFTFS